MEANCFTVLCWVLPYIHMNQQWLYVCPSLVNLPPPLPLQLPALCCHRAPDLSSLKHTANFHWLSSFTYSNVYVSITLSQFVHPLLPLLCLQVCPLCPVDTLLRKKAKRTQVTSTLIMYFTQCTMSKNQAFQYVISMKNY